MGGKRETARRLGKSDVELLMNAIDSEQLETVLATSLAILVGGPVEWDALLERAHMAAGWSDARRSLLQVRDRRAMEDLASELNERRRL